MRQQTITVVTGETMWGTSMSKLSANFTEDEKQPLEFKIDDKGNLRILRTDDGELMTYHPAGEFKSVSTGVVTSP